MRVVALISGGKDSCYNMVQCVAAGHEIVALANLQPAATDELDSFMYQTVGHNGVEMYAEAMELPLYRHVIKGTSLQQDRDYVPTAADEVEDLYELLQKVKTETDVDAVSVGAILSDYQRVRVESVCVRLGLVPLAYLWRRDQTELLQEMLDCRIEAIIIKVAALGLDARHLGMPLGSIMPHLLEMKEKYGLNVCGEGGEYETFTLDCPLFTKTVVIDESETVVHSNDAFAPVGYLSFKKMRLVSKDCSCSSQRERLQGLSVRTPLDFLVDVNPEELLEEEREKDERERENSAVNGGTDVLPDSLDENEETFREEARLSSVPVVQVDPKGWCWFGCIAGSGPDPVLAIKDVMRQVKDILFARDYSLSDIVAVTMYIGDMKVYAAMNAEYATYFTINPPIRVCVEAPLPPGTHICLEGVAFRFPNETPENRRELRHHMHVQGISNWAPANIGPYSQAARVQEILYVAGSIGLVPGTMQMVEGGIKAQCKLALRHMGRIVRAVDSKIELRDVVQATCFVTKHAYIAEACKEWEKRSNNAVVDYVVVPGLPRNALVEWHIWAHRYNSSFEYEETGCYVQENVKASLRRRWNYENTVAVVVCQVTPGSTDIALEEAGLMAALRYALRKLSKDAPEGAAGFLRVFYKVGGVSPGLVEQSLLRASCEDGTGDNEENRNFVPFAFSVVPACGLAHQRTLLSICGTRHQ